MKNSEKNTTSNKLKTVDLFAGIGGIRLGFEQAGFKTVYANDIDKYCKITYDFNFLNTKLTVKDITKKSTWSFSSVLDDIKKIKYNFLLGGFPCQAFSIAGYGQGFNDKKGRGDLFFHIAEILEVTQPLGFLLENVKNLKNHDKKRTFKIIEKTLKSLGYHIKSKVLNSMDYGNVPQTRERIYIVGFKNKLHLEKFKFPNKIPLKKSVEDVLEANVDDYYYYENKPLWDKLKKHEINRGSVYQWRRVYLRENKKHVCPTLTANMGTGGHNVPIIRDHKGVRKLTPKECLRIQGFDEDFYFPVNVAKSRLYKQAGNSVTVSVINRIAERIKIAVQ